MSNLAKSVQDLLLAAAAFKAETARTPGSRATGTLRLAANLVEAETVTIGPDTYEVETLNVDTTIDTSLGEWNNTTNPILVTMAAHGLVAGDNVAVGTEVLKCLRVVDVNHLVFLRGRAGTTNAAHADGVSIFKGNGVVAGRIPWVTAGTLTPAVMGPSLAAEINNVSPTGVEVSAAKSSTIYTGVNAITATSLQSGAEVFLEAVNVGVLALALTETLAGVNNVWGAATMVNGMAPANKRFAAVAVVPTATDVALGVLRFSFPFLVSSASVNVLLTADGTPIAWNGGITGIGTARITVDNAGATDWSASHTVYIVARE
jgi:hypothetical protein